MLIAKDIAYADDDSCLSTLLFTMLLTGQFDDGCLTYADAAAFSMAIFRAAPVNYDTLRFIDYFG